MPKSKRVYNRAYCMNVSLKLIGIKGLLRAVGTLDANTKEAISRAMSRCAQLAKRESIRNAPRSPTMKILSNHLKVKKHTRQRTHPGGLEKSIECESNADRAVVFVGRNSYAAKYAKYIHDEKGKRWFKRGPGTIAKGARADSKFIERAINDNSKTFRKILDDEIKRKNK